MADINWSDAKTRYVTTNLSYRQIAEEFGVSHSQMRQVGAREKWTEARNSFRTKAEQKKQDAAVRKEVSKYERVVSAADRLLDKIEQAIDELDKHIVTHKSRERVIEYKNRERPDKPTRETIKDEERIEAVESIINRDGIKALAQALLAVKDIQGLKSKLDIKEQKARIDKLIKDSERDSDEAKQITVKIEGGGEWTN